jgi:hypothetical protein
MVNPMVPLASPNNSNWMEVSGLPPKRAGLYCGIVRNAPDHGVAPVYGFGVPVYVTDEQKPGTARIVHTIGTTARANLIMVNRSWSSLDIAYYYKRRRGESISSSAQFFLCCAFFVGPY